MERKKTIHQLDSPFAAVQWPQVSPDDQDTILELLCSLLSPLGHHRRSFASKSKGQRAKDRKRKRTETESASANVPPIPELSSHVDLGLASISRSLEKMSSRSQQDRPSEEPNPEPYSVVFVARSGQPSAFHSHLPQMIAIASRSLPSSQSIRLVGLSAACEERLSSCLGIPRVSSIGLREGAPQAKALVDFVREHIPPVDMAWLQEVPRGQYLETKINALEVPVGTKKQTSI